MPCAALTYDSIVCALFSSSGEFDFFIAYFFFIQNFCIDTDYSGGTKILGVWHHFEFSIPFAVRNMLHSHPAKTLLFAGLVICGSCSYSLHVCDREVAAIADAGAPWTNSLMGSFWIVLITMPAVGYGGAHMWCEHLPRALFVSAFLVFPGVVCFVLVREASPID